MNNVDSSFLQKDDYGNLIADERANPPVTECETHESCAGCPRQMKNSCVIWVNR